MASDFMAAGTGSVVRLLAHRERLVLGEARAHQEGEQEPRLQEGRRYARSNTAEIERSAL